MQRGKLLTPDCGAATANAAQVKTDFYGIKSRAMSTQYIDLQQLSFAALPGSHWSDLSDSLQQR